MTDQPPAADVPCNGCTACCRRDLIILHPESGDDPTAYPEDHLFEITNPFTGVLSKALRVKPNGDCIYLDRDTGCTNYDRRPAVCRTLDCRWLWFKFKDLSRADRRRDWRVNNATLQAGRKRYRTLFTDS